MSAVETPSSAALAAFLDEQLGGGVALSVEPMQGGGSCEIFGLERGGERWVLRRAPEHASSSTAHDVLREFRILDAVKDEPVSIARPIVACADPEVFGAPFYVMERIDGVPIRSGVPQAWAEDPSTQGQALEQLIDALVAIHAVDWEMAAIGDPLVDLAWAMIFHPGPEGTMPLGLANEPRFDRAVLPSAADLLDRYAEGSGRDLTHLAWYDVFSRWKLAIVLEGSYAKFLRGESSKPIHEFFGRQVDLLLDSAAEIVSDQRDTETPPT